MVSAAASLSEAPPWRQQGRADGQPFETERMGTGSALPYVATVEANGGRGPGGDPADSHRATDLPSVAVVVPTAGRRPRLLVEVAQAVLSDDATTELIVVLDGRSPVAERLLGEISDSRLTALPFRATEPGHHRGQEARDHAVRAAASDVILALDDDVVPQPGLVSGHASHHRDADDLVIVGYMPVARSDSAAVRLYARAYEGACLEFDRDPGSILLGLWGGNVSVRRTQWLRAVERPLVDAGYHGDQEFGLRLHQIGLRAVFDRSLRADHMYERTLQALIRDAELSAASRIRLQKSYGRWLPERAPQAPLTAWIVERLAEFMRRPRSWRIGAAALTNAARGAGTAGLLAVEDRIVSLLYRLAWVRAANALNAEAYAPLMRAPEDWAT